MDKGQRGSSWPILSQLATSPQLTAQLPCSADLGRSVQRIFVFSLLPTGKVLMGSMYIFPSVPVNFWVLFTLHGV